MWLFNIDDIGVEQCAEERLRLASLVSSSEGCNIHSQFHASRATGSIHFVPGRLYQRLGWRVRETLSATTRQLNLSHTVHALEFGDPFPGQVNPLAETSQIRGQAGTTGRKALVNGRYSYNIKIVPTLYQTSSLWMGGTSQVESYQYSVTRHFNPTEGADGLNLIPGVFVLYDLSPIKIQVSRTHPYPSLLHFILQLCAVCGGVLTVGGIIDAVMHHGMRRLKKSREGKLT